MDSRVPLSALIIDDEPCICEILQEVLEENGFNVYTSNNGQDAKQAIVSLEPRIIISDIKIPLFNGVELLHFVKRTELDCKFILMTGFSNLMKHNEAIELGCDFFLEKPFDNKYFIRVVKEVLGIVNEKVTLREDDFIRLDINYFVMGKRAPCNLYVKLRENYFVKVADKDAEVNKSFFERYKKRSVFFLYILKNDYSDYLGLNFRLLNMAQTKNIPKEKLSSLITNVHDTFMSNTLLCSIDPDEQADVLNYSKSIFNIISANRILFQLLEDTIHHNNKIFSHELCCASLCYLVAKRVGWTSEPLIFRVFLAGLLHDIGMTKIPVSIYSKKPLLRTKEEQEEYQRHTQYSAKILNKIKGMPEEVILAGLQHHEFIDGSGFIKKLKKSSLSKVTRLVSLCDLGEKEFFCGSKEKSISNFRTAIYKELLGRPTAFEPEYMEALAEILHLNTLPKQGFASVENRFNYG